MATLTNTKIKDTYPALLKASDNGVIGATEKVITDGLGNDSVLKLGTASASFTSDIEVNRLTIGKGANDVSTNTALGYQTLENATGGGNTAVGYASLLADTTGVQNTAVGINALGNNTTGSFNVSVGSSSLEDNIDGADNVAVGYSSLSSNTSGSQNIAVGRQALLSNTTGGNNTAVGHSSLVGNITGINNTAVGRSSLFANTGSNNTAVGAYALLDNTTGTRNTAIGYLALSENTTGLDNVAVGNNSGALNTVGNSNTSLGSNSLYSNTASGNTAVGSYSLNANTSATQNTAVGADALRENTASSNTAVGHSSLGLNTTGAYNTGVGVSALYANQTGGNNTALGYLSLRNNTADYNTAVGSGSLYDNTSGTFNVALGYNSLYNNTTGNNNTAVGVDSLRNNTTGVNNTALGLHALRSNTEGNHNTSIGAYSLDVNTVGLRNTSVGYSALSSNTEGDDNTALGYNSLVANTTGLNNVAIGKDALKDNTTGGSNTSIGTSAIAFLNGTDNVAIGQSAGANTTGALPKTAGSQNTYVGAGIRSGAADTTNEIVIGYNTFGNGSNTATYGNSSITDHYFDGNITLTDATNPVLTVQDTAGGSSFLRLLSGDTGTSNIYLGDDTDDNAGAIVYDHSDNSMSFRTNGFLEKMSIDSSGNLAVDTNTLYVDAASDWVGIGTTTRLDSATKFQITANTSGVTSFSGGADDVIIEHNTNVGLTLATPNNAIASIYFTDPDRVNSGFLEYSHINDNFRIQVNGGEAMRIDSSGNVGIGEQNPNEKLSLAGTTSTTLGYSIAPSGWAAKHRLTVPTDGGTSMLSFNYNGSAIDSSLYGSASIQVARDKVIFSTGATGAAPTERMRIDSSGNVGIGRVPSEKLDIEGASPFIRLSNTDETESGIVFVDSASAAQSAKITYDSGASNALIFYNNAAAERMRITSGGQLLINTQTLPNGTSAYGAGFAPNSEARTTFHSASNTTSSIKLAYFLNPNGEVGSIATSGSATSYNTSSDYRLKENVVEMTGALDRVDALKPSRFNFIADPEKTVDGFLAHEVQAIVPEAVTGEKDEVDEEGNPIYQGIDQSKIVPLLVGAIKELKAEIELLKSQLS